MEPWIAHQRGPRLDLVQLQIPVQLSWRLPGGWQLGLGMLAAGSDLQLVPLLLESFSGCRNLRATVMSWLLDVLRPCRMAIIKH